MAGDLGLDRYAIKRMGVIHIERTVNKFRIDLEHLAYLLRQHRNDKPILEYWMTTVNLNIDAQFNAELPNHGGLAGLASGKKETVEGMTKWFKDLLVEHGKKAADEAKKEEENTKNRRKFIFQVFEQLSDHIGQYPWHLPETELTEGVMTLLEIKDLRKLAPAKEAIKKELEDMAKAQVIAWVKSPEKYEEKGKTKTKIYGPSGIVLLQNEKGEDTDTNVWSGKLSDNRPKRGRQSSEE